MGIGTPATLSLLPITAVAVFLVGLRWPASKAMPISYLVVAYRSCRLYDRDQSEQNGGGEWMTRTKI